MVCAIRRLSFAIIYVPNFDNVWHNLKNTCRAVVVPDGGDDAARVRAPSTLLALLVVITPAALLRAGNPRYADVDYALLLLLHSADDEIFIYFYFVINPNNIYCSNIRFNSPTVYNVYLFFFFSFFFALSIFMFKF